MDKYEIRVTKKGGKTPLIFGAVLASAHAAIRRAIRLGEEGDLIEVWLGLTCVYASGAPATARQETGCHMNVEGQTSDIGSAEHS
jgi:hypothetical protein